MVKLDPRGKIAVTPVRTESPSMIVLKPTSTWATSVIALYVPGVPSNGMPSSLARGFLGPTIRGKHVPLLANIIDQSTKTYLFP